jgi:hypothetical protein
MTINKHLPFEQMFQFAGASGLEMMNAFFNTTYYGKDIAYTVSNDSSHEVEEPEKFEINVKKEGDSIES